MVKGLGGGGYKPLTKIFDMFQMTRASSGVSKFYNDMLMQGGPDGNFQSETLFRKDKSLTLNNGLDIIV